MQDAEEFEKICRERDKQLKSIKQKNEDFEDKMYRLIMIGLFVMICLACFMLLLFSIAFFKGFFIEGTIK
jgi:uncharacterized membrane protein (DUF106 family)